MDTQHLQDLIEETNSRGGGIILNYQEKPAVVVLNIDKYNQLVSSSADKTAVSSGIGQISQDQIDESLNAFQKIPQEKSRGKILVTGGAGYIGAHAVKELLKSGYEVVVLDNLSTGKRENVSGHAKFIEGDLADINLLKDLFAQENFTAVMHFAASIEVEESVKEPEKYLQNNTLNTAGLLSVMDEFKCKKIIFSSTCAVYGNQAVIPINERAKLLPNNPYGLSKLLAERIIKFYSQFLGFHAVVFRYFNAAGCDFEAKIKPTHFSHLIPIVLEVAMGKRSAITVNGTDFNTFDGTCIRDFVHVVDIARAHVAALEKMNSLEDFEIFNIGTGKGSSVLEIINKASEVLNRIIPMEKGQRRAGDYEQSVADNRKIKEKLNFLPQYSDLETIITSSWQQMNS